jgi:hypothetical protein
VLSEESCLFGLLTQPELPEFVLLSGDLFGEVLLEASLSRSPEGCLITLAHSPRAVYEPPSNESDEQERKDRNKNRLI